MKKPTKLPSREVPQQKYRSAQFSEIGSVVELTKGQGGDSKDTDSYCIPVPVVCKWADETSDSDPAK